MRTVRMLLGNGDRQQGSWIRKTDSVAVSYRRLKWSMCSPLCPWWKALLCGPGFWAHCLFVVQLIYTKEGLWSTSLYGQEPSTCVILVVDFHLGSSVFKIRQSYFFYFCALEKLITLSIVCLSFSPWISRHHNCCLESVCGLCPAVVSCSGIFCACNGVTLLGQWPAVVWLQGALL